MIDVSILEAGLDKRTIDAAIVWDAIASNIAADVEAIAIPAEQSIISEVVLARLASSRRPDAATKFLAFVKGAKGQEILRKAGYRTSKP